MTAKQTNTEMGRQLIPCSASRGNRMIGRGVALPVKLVAVAVACLTPVGCGSPPSVYQDTRSDDGRCVCHITEHDDPKDGAVRILDLSITLDGRPVLESSYLGNKRWVGSGVKFTVGKAGRFYHMFAIGHPDYAVAAVDGGSGAVWFQSTNAASEHILQAFEAEPGKPKLTDLNWLNAFVLNARPGS